MEKLLYTGGTGFLGANTKPILDKQYNEETDTFEWKSETLDGTHVTINQVDIPIRSGDLIAALSDVVDKKLNASKDQTNKKLVQNNFREIFFCCL